MKGSTQIHCKIIPTLNSRGPKPLNTKNFINQIYSVAVASPDINAFASGSYKVNDYP